MIGTLARSTFENVALPIILVGMECAAQIYAAKLEADAQVKVAETESNTKLVAAQVLEKLEELGVELDG